MTKKRLRGFLSKGQREYLEFLRYEIRHGIEYDNRKNWTEAQRTPHRELDFQIRWKVRYTLRDLRLVFEKFGFIELRELLGDEDVIDGLNYLYEKADLVCSKVEAERRKREQVNNT